jgi:hypothetical protein
MMRIILSDLEYLAEIILCRLSNEWSCSALATLINRPETVIELDRNVLATLVEVGRLIADATKVIAVTVSSEGAAPD